MDIEKVFHMVGGNGETSYAANSSLQKRALDMVKHIATESIVDLYLATTPQKMAIADLGCSSGPNTLSVIGDIIDAIDRARRRNFMVTTTNRTTEIQVFLNDLPSNDFNSIFLAWPDFCKEKLISSGSSKCNGRNDRSHPPFVSIAGVPGSFYGRLFPSDTLHFIHSSFSLHWLSRVPPAIYDQEGKSINKGKIYISEASPPLVSEAYLMQFQEDFSLFLRSRSLELKSGGRMVLTLLGRTGPHHTHSANSLLWELLSRSFAILVSQGDIDEEKLNSYEIHFYAPSKEEIDDEVRKEGSFAIDRLELFEIESNMNKSKSNGSTATYGTTVATSVRAIQESLIRHHFGEHIVDDLFGIYGKLIDEETAKGEIRPISFIVALRKKV
ncbi:probable methyltransferase TCM_000336 [Telopea speciosissima]|uniref:probable methyltransferase TCM_000336 n=1 Tax=Telopea speciosissima TaxID=54955 RepID=UPI001CC3D1BB|nr:probable methyltransferase TCM_000336 [Telopea speciosissima]